MFVETMYRKTRVLEMFIFRYKMKILSPDQHFFYLYWFDPPGNFRVSRNFDWPANSTDLFLIVNLWNYLEINNKMVAKTYEHTNETLELSMIKVENQYQTELLLLISLKDKVLASNKIRKRWLFWAIGLPLNFFIKLYKYWVNNTHFP